MDKSNVIRSSEFFMSVGDILHYTLIIDSGATPTISLVSVGSIANSEEAPDAVVAIAASDITSSSFTANWYFIENASEYYLDVATDSAFTTMVAGYNNLSVGFVNEYSIVGLTDAYTYYYRVRGANWIGTGESSNTITTTTANELVVDEDGNVYTYVTIGTQQWLVENWRSTKYADGTPIPNLTLDADWIADVTGAYCAYDNDPLNIPDYGLLYNWYAVDNAHGLAPAGWRVPTDVDFNTFVAFLGGNSVIGGKLKEIGLTHWLTPNTGATDEYGFRALPGGYRRNYDGVFMYIYEQSHLWSSVAVEAVTASGCTVGVYNAINGGAFVQMKKNGYSIRMMRDVI